MLEIQGKDVGTQRVRVGERNGAKVLIGLMSDSKHTHKHGQHMGHGNRERK